MARIAVIGAGAKAAAIVARAATLRELGESRVPEIIVFEADHIGAAWSGKADFTSGYLTLCTPGEKDVGFPYFEVARRNPPIAPELFARFSWQAFLVADGRMADWVDRGREHPSHGLWATYLAWVFRRARQAVIPARVERKKVRRNGEGWRVEFVQGGAPKFIDVDGVVITGNGPARKTPADPNVPAERVFDAETFWAAREKVLKLRKGAVAVVGDGGAAGTIVAWLAERFAERAVTIYSVSPMGTLFPRGDGHSERRWFSDPTDWSKLTVDHRRRLIDRTEAGVVSSRIKQRIDGADNIEFRHGRAIGATWKGRRINLRIEYERQPAPSADVDYLINAIGFDVWDRLALVDDPAVEALGAVEAKAMRDRVELAMERDLSLPTGLGLPPGLHFPALASLARGPGMGNLGSLGLMAADVMRPYLA